MSVEEVQTGSVSRGYIPLVTEDGVPVPLLVCKMAVVEVDDDNKPVAGPNLIEREITQKNSDGDFLAYLLKSETALLTPETVYILVLQVENEELEKPINTERQWHFKAVAGVID